MSNAETDPIPQKWTIGSNCGQLAHELNCELGRHDVDELDGDLAPLLAAAAVELLQQRGRCWTLNGHEGTTLLLRLIARVALDAPVLGGSHSAALLAELEARNMGADAAARVAKAVVR